MLKNTFRKIMGVLIVVIFGVAVYQFTQQTSGNEYVRDALIAGTKFLLALFLVVWGLHQFDQRMKKRPQ